jgi:hypothetical protein
MNPDIELELLFIHETKQGAVDMSTPVVCG